MWADRGLHRAHRNARLAFQFRPNKRLPVGRLDDHQKRGGRKESGNHQVDERCEVGRWLWGCHLAFDLRLTKPLRPTEVQTALWNEPLCSVADQAMRSRPWLIEEAFRWTPLIRY